MGDPTWVATHCLSTRHKECGSSMLNLGTIGSDGVWFMVNICPSEHTIRWKCNTNIKLEKQFHSVSQCRLFFPVTPSWMISCHFCPTQSGDRVWSYITIAGKYPSSNSELEFLLKGYCYQKQGPPSRPLKEVLYAFFTQPYQHGKVKAAGRSWWRDKDKLSATAQDGPDGAEGEEQKDIPHFWSSFPETFPDSLQSENHSSPGPAIWDSAPPTANCIAKHSI